MDDMTWMSSFYEPPFQPLERQPVLAVVAAAVLTAVRCGGARTAARLQALAPDGRQPATNPAERRLQA